MTTNNAGNGNARFTFAAEPPAPITTHGILWQFTGPNGVAYETACHPLRLD